MNKVHIVWSSEDIKTVRPEWSDEQCEEFFASCSKTLQDRSTEVGWDIIDMMLPPRESPVKCVLCGEEEPAEDMVWIPQEGDKDRPYCEDCSKITEENEDA